MGWNGRYPRQMNKVVNLNQVKKARAKAAAAILAAANRVKHGRTGARKADDQRQATRQQALLDGVKRDETETS